MYYETEIKALNRSKIKYLIVGGLAVNLYGVQRLTRDLDLMIDIPGTNLSLFYRIMDKMGYFTNVDLLKAKKLTALSFHHKTDEYKQIDVFVKNPINFLTAYERRENIKVGRIDFPCASMADIIEMKERSGRDRDLIDIGALKKLKREGK